jgi:hypothetical protein
VRTLLAFSLVAAPAFAQDDLSRFGLDGEALRIVDEAAQTCALETDGGILDIAEPGAAFARVDLDGDGGMTAAGLPDDLVIDFNLIFCDRAPSLWSGTGGAPIHILPDAGAGMAVTGFGWSLVGEAVPPVLLVARHGSHCDAEGSAPCVQAFVVADGRVLTVVIP